jgi:hypothetical protein
MEDTNDILNSADGLAEFSNLEPAGVEDFRKTHAGFVPDFWWNESVSGLTGATVKIWQVCQAHLQEAWKSGPGKRPFSLTACIRLISAGVRPEEPVEGRDYHVEPREQSTIYHINMESDLWLAGTRVWPYQQAVMFLGTNPWRALFCGLCGRRFVADKPGRRFCSETCTKEARKRGQLAWWNQHGENWRNGKTKQKETRKSAKKISKTKKENA